MNSKFTCRRLSWIGLAAAILLIPHGLVGQLQPSEHPQRRLPWQRICHLS
jgi:hypothetical protein